MTSLARNNPIQFFLRKLALAPPFLKTKFYSRLCGRLARLGGLNGHVATNLGISHRLRVDYPDENHFTQIFGTPLHYQGERGALHLIERLLPTCGAFIDIGAYVGYYTYFAATKARKSPVIFMEPNPKLFKFISETSECNALTNVRGYPFAIGDSDRSDVFFIDQGDPTSSCLKPTGIADTSYEEVSVQVRTFDSFLTERNDLTNLIVKVDVENAEFEFFQGARNCFHRVDFLILEALLPAIKKGIIPQIMKAGNFHSYYINDFQLEPLKDWGFTYSPGQFNWLFCRLSPEELRHRLSRSKLVVSP